MAAGLASAAQGCVSLTSARVYPSAVQRAGCGGSGRWGTGSRGSGIEIGHF